MIQAVIFDMDGLMFDTERVYYMGIERTGKEFHLQNALGIFPRLMGVSAAISKGIYLDFFGKDFPYDAFISRRQEIMDEIIRKDGVPVKPGLTELLSFLREKDYRTAVATSTSRGRTMEYLEQTDVVRFFDAVICGDMLERSKPDPDIYLKAAGAIGSAPSVCMALEDSPNGIRSAHAAGMKAVMVPDMVQPDEELEQLLYACVPTLRDVIPLLRADRREPEKNKP